MFTIWGQFVDHDITLTPFQHGEDAERFDIEIPRFDPFFDPNGTGTEKIKFTRSIFKENSSPRDQINVITAWLDGSQVYGSHEDTASNLRTYQDGKLRVSAGNLLPTEDGFLFVGGDERANENVALTSLHTIFMR